MSSHAEDCIECIRKGGKILVCGNGGSAAQAQHLVAELVVRYLKNRRALPAIALTADQAVLTACANDFGYEQIFSRQVEAIGKPGDVLIAISTSGKSQNVLKAIEIANQIGMKVVDTSQWGGETIAEKQENHLRYIHQLAEEIENAFT